MKNYQIEDLLSLKGFKTRFINMIFTSKQLGAEIIIDSNSYNAIRFKNEMEMLKERIDNDIIDILENYKYSKSVEILSELNFTEDFGDRLDFINQVRKIRLHHMANHKYEQAFMLKKREKELVIKLNLQPHLDVFNKKVAQIIKKHNSVYEFYAYMHIISKVINQHLVIDRDETIDLTKKLCLSWVYEELLNKLNYSTKRDYTHYISSFKKRKKILEESIMIKIC